jgi:hypothetical protein
MPTFHFELLDLPPEAEALRSEVREFLRTTLHGHSAHKRARSWGGFDREFSQKVGARGWIGLTWPKKYGGHERSALERYVMLEEMLAAGAPVSAHWIADRRAAAPALRDGGAARAVPAPNRARGAGLRHRDERAGLGLRPGLDPYARRAGQRRLQGQRHQGLDEQRAPVRLHDRAVPDARRPRQEARGPLAVPRGYQVARHHDPAHHRPHRQAPLQRGGLRTPLPETCASARRARAGSR